MSISTVRKPMVRPGGPIPVFFQKMRDGSFEVRRCSNHEIVSRFYASHHSFESALRETDTFCYWAAYKIAAIVEQ